MSEQRLRFGRLTVELSNTAKVFYPADGITKGEVIDYYRAVADRVLPHLRARPIVMARYPDGIDGERVFQKNAPAYFPDWVTTAEVKKQHGTVRHVVCDKAATLVYLANQGCIEPHIFLSRLDHLEHPDQLVFDLDPPDESAFGTARRTALRLRELLEGELGLTSYVKTTGGKGLHVHLPLNRRADFEATRGFARAVAEVLVRMKPGELTTKQRKRERSGRLFIDVMRNAYAQTVVAPYALRARAGAPVATPLRWTELDDDTLKPDRFTIRTIGRRLADRGDPWEGSASPSRASRQDLRRAWERVAELAHD
jgi:bifunctional non-homologous end joining protein LigD